ncbi:hypothetical protein L2E82_46435 [Cichorium intybus]|uniref:Uncharacterized protein n=1 Tax=Cichorium intybus TaxID=13427 RepID=A0ACB8YTF9_CICIN|nr:hypothetical protein L2E82_46435 [Cichorium intybus]
MWKERVMINGVRISIQLRKHSEKMSRQMFKKEQLRIFSSSDDSTIKKHVLATHAPDGREVDLDLLISIIEEAFHHAIPDDINCVIDGSHTSNIYAIDREERAPLLGFEDIKGTHGGLANIIHNISCEFSCKCSGGDAHASTLAILNMLSSYSWEAKAVISLGAFAVNFGEFWLLAQSYATNPLANSIALLKHMPNIIEHYESLKTRFDAINLVIKATLDVTKCVITFRNLPQQYMHDDQPPKSIAIAHVPTATYWSIKSMVACTSQLTSLLGMNYDMCITATSEATELSSLAHKVHNIHEHLKSILVLCYENIEEKQEGEHDTRILEARHGEPMSNQKTSLISHDCNTIYHQCVYQVATRDSQINTEVKGRLLATWIYWKTTSSAIVDYNLRQMALRLVKIWVY